MIHAIVQSIRVIGPELVRLAAVLCATAGLTLALGMIFPVQYELDTAGYRETAALTSAPSMARPDEVDDIRAALDGAPTAVYIDFFTEVSASNGRTIGPISLWALLGERIDAEATLMPDATRVAGGPRDPRDDGDWIDLSADIAATLGVSPGQQVEAGVATDEPIRLTVRGVYAVRSTGVAGMAMMSGAALARHDPGIDLTSNSLATAAAPEAVETMLNEPPWSSRMNARYGGPVDVERTSDQLLLAQDHAFGNFGLTLGISLIAYVALLAILVAEAVATVRTFRNRAAVLLELGARPRAVHGGLLLGVGLTIVLAIPAGAALGMLAYTTGFAGPTLPPAVAATWWTATGVVIGCGLVTVFLTAWTQHRQLTLAALRPRRKAHT